jgi:hypothetical protein
VVYVQEVGGHEGGAETTSPLSCCVGSTAQAALGSVPLGPGLAAQRAFPLALNAVGWAAGLWTEAATDDAGFG